MKLRSRFNGKSISNDRGLALVTAILLLLVLATLMVTSTHWTAMDIKRTAKYSKTREAFFIADAGIQDAINHMNYDAFGNSPGAAADNFASALTNWPAEFTNGIPDPGGKGTYTVSVADNHDDGDDKEDVDNDFTVIVTSTATTNRGETAVIEAVLHLPRAQGGAAVIVQDNLKIVGNVSVSKLTGNLVHSNDETSISGSVSLSGGATGVNGCTLNGNPDATCDSGIKYQRDIPKFFPKDYKEFAHYIMKSDGTILDQVNNVLYTSSGGQWVDSLGNPNPKFDAFSYKNDQGWSTKGVKPSGGDQDVPNEAILYFESAFETKGGPSDDPWSVTILAEKDIVIKSQAYINNCTSACSSDEAIASLFLIAGDDIKTTGLKSTVQGIIAALDQVKLGGNAELAGAVISNSFDGTYKGDTYLPYDSNVANGTGNKIHGNVTIVFNGPVPIPVTENKVRVLTWKECTPKDIVDSIGTCS